MNRYCFVHAHEEAVFICRLLKPIFRFKLVYDMHSCLPQQLTNFQFTKSKILIKIFEHLEESCLHVADVIITVCPDLSSYVNRSIRDRGKHFMIENSIFEPVRLLPGPCANNSDNAASALNELNRKFTEGIRFVVYAGTLEPYQGIDFLLEAFKKVAAAIPDVSLLIVGGDKKQVQFYKNLASKNGLKDKIIFTGCLSQLQANQYLNLASVLVSPRLEGTNTPLKIYEQLASGVPLVATNIYAHAQVLNDHVAYLVDPQPANMARGILEALKTDKNTLIKAKNAKRLYEKKYSRSVYEAKMREVLKLLST
jgi:glycosyltransferase involved in cell wall biosynthesis